MPPKQGHPQESQSAQEGGLPWERREMQGLGLADLGSSLSTTHSTPG